jgi:hypothetical protein
MVENAQENDGHATPHNDEFIDFWTWFLKVTKLRMKVVGGAGIVVPIIAVAYYVTGIIKNANLHLPFHAPNLYEALRFSYAAQIVVVFLVLVLNATVEINSDERFPYGSSGQGHLRMWWSIALISFLLLYIFLWVHVPVGEKLQSLGPGGPAREMTQLKDDILRILANLCNNLSTFAFLMCFSTLESKKRNVQTRTQRWLYLWLGCLVMLTFVEAAFRFGNTPDVATWHINWFELITGANAGIALAMFCGRISSPLIDPPLSVMAGLYLYAVVQISFGFWDRPEIGLVMGNVCLILKCLLSLVIAWLLTTRHLLFYLERVHSSRSELAVWRNEFRTQRIAQIKPFSAGK